MRETVDDMLRRVHTRLGQMDMTTDDLADRMGVSRPRVSQLINGEEITAHMFERLTVALDVEPGWWQVPIARPSAVRPDPAQAMFDSADKISRGG